MPFVAPATQAVAAANRKETVNPTVALTGSGAVAEAAPNGQWHQLAQGLLDQSHKASEAKKTLQVKDSGAAHIEQYGNLDTVKDQQIPNEPPAAPTTQTGTVTDPTTTEIGVVG